TGLTQDALVGLIDEGENSDRFFLSVIEGLHRMQENGTNLIPVLREMGIINTRDVDVLARLAANWDVVADSVSGASSAFEDGQYLYKESDRIFATLTARVQILANTFNEFLFNAFEAIAPFVTQLVEGATAAIRFMDSIGAAPLVGFSALVLAGAAALGTLGIAVTTVTRGILALRTAQSAVGAAMTSSTAATVANTGATTAAAASQRGLAAAIGTTTAGIRTVSTPRSAVVVATAGSAGAAVANTGATTAAAAAQRGRAAAIGTTTAAIRTSIAVSPAGWIAGITLAVVSAKAAFDGLTTS